MPLRLLSEKQQHSSLNQGDSFLRQSYVFLPALALEILLPQPPKGWNLGPELSYCQ